MAKKIPNLTAEKVKAIHVQPKKLGVLLLNLGSPDSLSVWDVYRYLSRFLSDRRVVPLPGWFWKPILNCGILPIRSFQSRARYKSIWSDVTGSPLSYITRQQAEAVQSVLAEEHCVVRCAMRYSSPDIEQVTHQLIEEDKVSHLLFVPLYPQYASSTTGSTIEEIARVLEDFSYIPPFHIVHHFHDDERYILPVRNRLSHFLSEVKAPLDRLIISFHGLPKVTLLGGDPYHCFCQKTARLLMEGLAFPSEKVEVCFQSRVGLAKWLGPYTKEHLEALARDQGVRRVAVICPGFVADCLETLEEIEGELKDAFLAAGGESFSYIPCINTDPVWIEGLCSMIRSVSHSVFNLNSLSSTLPSEADIQAFLRD